MTIQRAIEILKKGGVVAFPTETFYGLGGDPTNAKTIARLFKIKKRDGTKPIPLILSSEKILQKWVVGIKKREKNLIKKYWPGPLTLICRAKKEVHPQLTAGSGKIGVRVSNEPIARKLAQALGGAITATSANFSGEPSISTANEVLRRLGKKIDGVVSRKKMKPSKGSTIIDVTEKELKLIREGDISFEEILLSLRSAAGGEAMTQIYAN